MASTPSSCHQQGALEPAQSVADPGARAMQLPVKHADAILEPRARAERTESAHANSAPSAPPSARAGSATPANCFAAWRRTRATSPAGGAPSSAASASGPSAPYTLGTASGRICVGRAARRRCGRAAPLPRGV
jgi:hypothetical protein